MNKRIIAALLIIAFAAAGVAAGAAAARYKDDLERPTSGDADDATYEPPTGNTDNVSGTESTDQAAEPEMQESEPQETEIVTEPVTQEPVTEPEPPKSIWPDESYVGAWREHVNGNPCLQIWEVTKDKILFSVFYYRECNFEVTAIEKDGEIVFGSEVSPDFIYGPEGLNGKLIFDKDRIIMIFDNHFEKETTGFDSDPTSYNGPIYYEFDYKTEMEKETVETHLKNMNPLLYEPEFMWPDESYVGDWHENENGGLELCVFSVTQDKIFIAMSFGFEVTAIEKDGEIVFGSEVSPDFIYGPEGLNGKLIFDKDRIILILDNHFEEKMPGFPDYACFNGPVFFKFGHKNEIDKEILEANLKYINAKPEPEPEPVTEPEPEPQSEAERKKAEIVKADEEWAMQNRVIPDVIPKFDAGSMKIYSAKEATDKIPLVCGLYRAAYYATPQRLVNSVSNSRTYTWWDKTLVDFDEYCDWWYENIVPKIESPGEPNEMYIVSFIKHFRIPKEDFEKACEEERLRLEKLRDENGVDISSEEYEIPNADIIYTFDNDIINEYYRR